MACPTHEMIVDFAFAEANEEPLTPEQESVSAHASSCDACGRALSDCRQIIAAARRLYATTPVVETRDCLDDNALAEFLDDAMTAEERAVAETHLAACRRCMYQFMGLSDDLLSVGGGVDSIAYVVAIARRGLRMITHPEEGYVDCSPTVVATLGDEARRICRWTQSIDDLELEITVEYTDADHATVTVKPILRHSPDAAAYLTLKSDETLVQSESLDDSGAFVLRDLSTGEYAVEVNLQDGMRIPVRLVLTRDQDE